VDWAQGVCWIIELKINSKNLEPTFIRSYGAFCMKQLLRGRSGRKNTAHATLKQVYTPFKAVKKYPTMPKEKPQTKPKEATEN
jgi:hypothetical protein